MDLCSIFAELLDHELRSLREYEICWEANNFKISFNVRIKPLRYMWWLSNVKSLLNGFTFVDDIIQRIVIYIFKWVNILLIMISLLAADRNFKVNGEVFELISWC